MKVISKVTVTEEITLITISNLPSDLIFLSEVLGFVSAQNISIDMISQSINAGHTFDFSFTINDSQLEKILTIISAIRENHKSANISVSSGNTKIVLYGETMPKESGVAYDALKLIADNEIMLTLITTSETDISLLFSPEYGYKAVDLFDK